MCIDMAYLIWQPFTRQENGETILSHGVKASKDVTGQQDGNCTFLCKWPLTSLAVGFIAKCS